MDFCTPNNFFKPSGNILKDTVIVFSSFHPSMTIFATPESRWSAVKSRDPLASNAFIYSVTTTKIYCRPNCPSRLARRSNVVFHDTVAEAEAAGFRPCKRCLPNAIGSEKDPQVNAVEKACGLIGEEGERQKEKWSVRALGIEVGLTESHFCRVFKKVTGMTVGEYRSHLLVSRDVPSKTNRLETDENHEALSLYNTSEDCTSAMSTNVLGTNADWLGSNSTDFYSDLISNDANAIEDSEFSIPYSNLETSTCSSFDLSNAEMDYYLQFTNFSNTVA